jgi:hypothetical protein
MRLTANEVWVLARDARVRLEELRLSEPAVKVCAAALARMEKVLSRPPRVAIMGEVNSGKTTVADLLLGGGVLQSSVVTNTHVPVLIRWADSLSLDVVTQQGKLRLTQEKLDELPSGLQLKRIEIGLPNERLAAFEILDTPGGYVPVIGGPDAQIFVWCTVATRAWTESERAHWSSLPRRCWRNGLLVATHKDALANSGETARVEQRLRGATSGMFRDVMFVGAGRTPRRVLPLDESGSGQSEEDLLDRVADRASEISNRRARKAERIIRRIARLTFHRLAPGPMNAEAAAILKAWEADCARLLTGVGGSPESVARVIEALLARFAHSLSEARTGRPGPRTPVTVPDKGPPGRGPFPVPAARRYAALIGADLTALLRIDLAQWGLRDPTMYHDYAEARSILLPLANLDATYSELGRRFAASSTASAGRAPAPALLMATRS